MNLIDAVTYDNSTFPACGLIAVLTPNQPSVNENANGNAQGESIGRCPNGQGGAFVTSGWQTHQPTPAATNSCVSNVYSFSITQPGGCGGFLTLSVQNATPGNELYNLISLLCSSPPGTGPLFGLAVGPGSGDPLGEVFFPIGTHPFHVLADTFGAYSLSFPTSPCPGTPAVGRGREHPGAPRDLQHPGHHADDDLRQHLHLIARSAAWASRRPGPERSSAW